MKHSEQLFKLNEQTAALGFTYAKSAGTAPLEGITYVLYCLTSAVLHVATQIALTREAEHPEKDKAA
jgi:hypothetical protein